MAKLVANPTYAPLAYSPTGYGSFKDFYPYYLGEHHHPINRTLHITGTLISASLQSRALLGLIPLLIRVLNQRTALLSGSEAAKDLEQSLSLSLGDAGRLLGASTLVGYAFAWVGHFFFEKNRPATFKHPFFSLRGDYTLLFQVLMGQRKMYP